MITKLSVLQKLIVLLLLAIGVSGCSKKDGSRIIGHWRADRVQVQSISIPMGPDFVISRSELVSIDGAIHIPVSSIAEQDNEVILNIPAGIGLSFYFEGADRIYFKLPVLDRVYFHRVSNVPEPTHAIPPPTPGPPPQEKTSLAPPATSPDVNPTESVNVIQTRVSKSAMTHPATRSAGLIELVRQAEQEMTNNHLNEAEALLIQAQQQFGSEPIVDYNLAILRIRQKNEDAAIRHLSEAFQHGFRAFSLLEASTELSSLKTDVRYEALLARYK
jgi:hypothetical protein